MELLIQGNGKVGPDVYVWNLPVFSTCPGATALCKSECYADWGYFRFPRNRSLNAARLAAAEADDFVSAMRWELERRGVRDLRLHSSGDFYSQGYIRKWFEILQANPRVQAFAYTRSWRLSELLPELKRLARLPNIRLQFSCDVETGLPPVVEGVTVNFLQAEHEVIPDPAGRVTLIWRTRRSDRPPAKRLALPLAPRPAFICPHYQGGDEGDEGDKITCQECRFCID